MDFDVSSVEGTDQFQEHIQVQQVPNDTDPLMWWKQHQEEFSDLTRMDRQYLTVPVTSVSPERFFSRVGLVKSLVQTDLRGSLLDTTKQAEINKEDTHTPHTQTHYLLTE